MSEAQRIVFGHALMGLGLWIRRTSAPVALIGCVALLAAHAFGARLSLLGADAGIVTVGWQTAVLAAALLVAARLAAVLTGAAGWCVFPDAHRAMLTRVVASR